jgi:hypothetical protein
VNTIEEVARLIDNRQQIDMLILDFSKAFDTVRTTPETTTEDAPLWH